MKRIITSLQSIRNWKTRGDGRSFRLSELEESAEGNLASITFLKRRLDTLAETLSGESGSSLLVRVRQLELDIAALKNMKLEMSEQEFYDRLENLLIKLALLNEEIEIGKK